MVNWWLRKFPGENVHFYYLYLNSWQDRRLFCLAGFTYGIEKNGKNTFEWRMKQKCAILKNDKQTRKNQENTIISRKKPKKCKWEQIMLKIVRCT